MPATTAPLPGVSRATAVEAVDLPGDAATLTRALGGAYQVVRPLGAGGMGTVYMAEHARLGRAVALKVLCPPLCFRDPVVERRFRREARLAARINHPNVAQIYDLIALQDERLVLVMEYVAGETLAARIRREGPLHPAEVVRVAGALADGLDHAHALGIVHGDVKPANVILSEGGAKLLDFGIAHDLFANPTTGEFPAGTPHYMSPEQIAGESPGVASDVFGLGAVLYEALAGRPIRSHPSGATALHQRPTSPGGSVAELRGRCPPGLADAILRALEPLPSARWPSAGALAQAALGGLDPPASLGRRLAPRSVVSSILDRVWPRRS